MTSDFTFNRNGRYDVYVGNGLYSLIPTLLELPDIKCGEFKEKIKKLIDDLLIDIENINDPSKKMLYDDNVHLKNAREVIRAMFACFNCILQKIKDENNTVKCIEDPETNQEQPIANISESLGILQQTFNLTSPEPIVDEKYVSESQSTSSSSSSTSSSPRSSTNSRSSFSSISSSNSRKSSAVSSITDPSYRSRISR
jgi:hypothetical protein